MTTDKIKGVISVLETKLSDIEQMTVGVDEDYAPYEFGVMKGLSDALDELYKLTEEKQV